MSVVEFDRRILKEDYRNYDLVARYWKGRYCGRIWKKNETFDEFEGDSLEDIIQHMRDVVDQHIDQKIRQRGNREPSMSEIADAFNLIWKKLKPSQIRLLHTHARAQDGSISMADLQDLSGYSSSAEMLLDYADIGNRLINELGYLPKSGNNLDPALSVLLEVDGTRSHSIDGKWVLKNDIVSVINHIEESLKDQRQWI